MPVSKSLKKVSKKVQGHEKNLHPNGRKFKQLNRANLRQEKLDKNRHERINVNEAKILRFKYLQEAVKLILKEKSADGKDVTINDIITPISENEIIEVIETFLKRDDDVLEKMKSERRPGRPASTKQDQLQQRIDKEWAEYKTGFCKNYFFLCFFLS